MKWAEKDKDNSKCFKSNFLEICLPLVSFIHSVIKTYLHVIQFSMYRNYLQDLQIMKKRFPVFFSFDIVFTGVLLSSVFFLSFFIPLTLFSQTFAAPPAFDQVLIYDKKISNQKNDWVQTYGNDSANLGSDHVDLLAVDYFSDGKTLDITFWVKSNYFYNTIILRILCQLNPMLIKIMFIVFSILICINRQTLHYLQAVN